MKKLILPSAVIIAVLSIIGNILAFDRYSSSRPLITVNGEAITRKELQDRVDYLYSKQLLSSMIWQLLVEQAAASKNCVPSDGDVNDALNELLRSDPAVVENARHSDPALLVFKQDLKSNLALRNLRMAGITASQDEIQAYYNTHQSQFQLPQQIQTTLVLTANQTDAETAQRLLMDNVATSIIADQPGLHVVGVNYTLPHELPNSVGQAVLAMKPNEVKVIPVDNAFAVVKAKNVSTEGVPPLSDIYNQVKIATILSKSPKEIDILKQLRASANIAVNIGKYKDAVPADVAPLSQSGSQTNP